MTAHTIATSRRRAGVGKPSQRRNSGGDKKFIPLTEKIFAVLRSMEEHPRRALTLDEITSSVGLAKTTVHRLLYSIRQLGYIDQDAQGNYQFSERFYALSGRSLPYYPLISAARPYLKALGSKSGESVQVGVLQNGLMLILAVEPSRKAYRCNGVVGECNYAHCTAIGKVILANLSVEDRKKYLACHSLPRFTTHTITERSQLVLQLEKIRQQGWSLNDAENVEGIASIAAPVFNGSGGVEAGLSITGPRSRMLQSIEQHKASIMQAARRLSNALSATTSSNS